MPKIKQLPEIKEPTRMLLSGNEAIALGAREVGVYFASAYPGTPLAALHYTSREFSKQLIQYVQLKSWV